MKIGIILTPDSRSKAYLQKIVNENFNFDTIIFMNDNRKEIKYSKKQIQQSKKYGFDISISVKQTLIENNLSFKELRFVDINHKELVNYLKEMTLIMKCNYF